MRDEQLSGEELARRKDEAIRQAFMWRFYYDDCGRVSQGHVRSDLRGPRVVVSQDRVRVNLGTTTSEQAA
jgi:hypothetical protein